MITEQLERLVRSALDRAVAEGEVRADGAPAVAFERPKRREHGDWATNVALLVGRSAGGPRAVAEALVRRMPPSQLVERVEVAGPGFLNFHLAPAWLHDVVRRAADPSGDFARSGAGSGTRVNVEYVSANPTGPANVVSGRHAAIGDAISNLLEATGTEVTREYYVNDAGRQIDLFAASLASRYLQHFDKPADLPSDGYRGEYLIDLARDIAEEVGDAYVDVPEPARVAALRRLGLDRMLTSIRGSLERFGTRFDVWFRESALHDGALQGAVELLRRAGWLEERDGALWFTSSRGGDDKDRVVVRAGGAPTYLASDVAYMIDKFERGFDHLIYVLGPDHHGTLPRLRATADAIGRGRGRVELPLVQTVTILRRGEAVQASKRAGVLVLLDELVDEVGADAARFTFLTRSHDTPLEFDIELVKEQAPENPVYYTQYAHARICSILRRAGRDSDRDVDAARAPLHRLAHPSEDALMRKLAAYEEVVPEAAAMRAPQKIARYVQELASDFSGFYRDCRVITNDRDLTHARLTLCVATREVIADALALLGVSAPERM